MVLVWPRNRRDQHRSGTDPDRWPYIGSASNGSIGTTDRARGGYPVSRMETRAKMVSPESSSSPPAAAGPVLQSMEFQLRNGSGNGPQNLRRKHRTVLRSCCRGTDRGPVVDRGTRHRIRLRPLCNGCQPHSPCTRGRRFGLGPPCTSSGVGSLSGGCHDRRCLCSRSVLSKATRMNRTGDDG
jgi:hypothetical protein